MNPTPIPILTITGSDTTGGSGIQADIKTITELGGYALTAITSITVQTTLGIQQIYDLPAHIVAGQIEAVMNDVQPRVVKVGMIRHRETVEAVAAVLRKYRPQHVVYAPVVKSSQGDELMDGGLVATIKTHLVPLCSLVIQLDDAKLHGMSNRYASAIAVGLGQGLSREEAIEGARAYVKSQMALGGHLRGRSSELYHDFVEAVEAHCQTNSDVRFYADRLNVSSRYLAQVTRRIASQSPKSIIDGHLLRHVQASLLHSELSVKEIAFRYGFRSQAHFAKFFRKQTGLSPTQYRVMGTELNQRINNP